MYKPLTAVVFIFKWNTNGRSRYQQNRIWMRTFSDFARQFHMRRRGKHTVTDGTKCTVLCCYPSWNPDEAKESRTLIFNCWSSDATNAAVVLNMCRAWICSLLRLLAACMCCVCAVHEMRNTCSFLKVVFHLPKQQLQWIVFATTYSSWDNRGSLTFTAATVLSFGKWFLLGYISHMKSTDMWHHTVHIFTTRAGQKPRHLFFQNACLLFQGKHVELWARKRKFGYWGEVASLPWSEFFSKNAHAMALEAFSSWSVSRGCVGRKTTMLLLFLEDPGEFLEWWRQLENSLTGNARQQVCSLAASSLWVASMKSGREVASADDHLRRVHWLPSCIVGDFV